MAWDGCVFATNASSKCGCMRCRLSHGHVFEIKNIFAPWQLQDIKDSITADFTASFRAAVALET